MNTQSHKHRTLVVLATAVLYAILFYRFEMGLNLLVFDAILLLSMFKLAPDLAVRPGVQWASAGLLFSAVMVVIVHGPAATLAHHVSYVLLLGFVQAKELRFIWFGLLLGLITLFTGPLAYLASLKGSVQNRVRGSLAGRVAPYCFAAIIAVPFFVLYLSGNGRLGEIVGTWMTVLGSASIGEHFFKCLFLIGSALLLSVGIFFPRTKGSKLTERQLNFRDQLRPEDGNEFEIMAGSATGAEPTPPRRLALITFGLLNILLLAVNVTDLSFVWLPTGTLDAATLSHYVHVGTGNLIASVCLAIGVVLYFFRGTLNWVANGKVKALAKFWIVQNFVLLCSVGVRNYHYVDAYGLAVGRVYVFFALAVLTFGLLTLYRKVTQRLTLSYLFQANGTALWLALLLFGAVNWPGVITRYNLATQAPDEVDWQYLYHGFDGRNDFLLAPLSAYHPVQRGRVRPVSTYSDLRGWNFADYRNDRARRRHQASFKFER